MSIFSKTSPDFKFICSFCKMDYPLERELKIHTFIHENCDDPNIYLSRSKLFVKPDSFPKTRLKSLNAPRNKIHENPKENNEFMNRSRYELGINKTQENFWTKPCLIALDKNMPSRQHSNDKPCKISVKNSVKPSAYEELIQLRKKYPTKSSICNSENSLPSTMQSFEQKLPKRRSSNDPHSSPDSGVFDEYDSPDSSDYFPESHSQSNKMYGTNFETQMPQKDKAEVDRQKIMNSGYCNSMLPRKNVSNSFTSFQKVIKKTDFPVDEKF